VHLFETSGQKMSIHIFPIDNHRKWQLAQIH
jgi:hypothetical protein